ncbi:MAG: hypothetical protein L0Z53_23905 [Acidobacteriales bacterium]|nr:hypothetical protein [Terriglobales bacterium]
MNESQKRISRRLAWLAAILSIVAAAINLVREDYYGAAGQLTLGVALALYASGTTERSAITRYLTWGLIVFSAGLILYRLVAR